MLADDQFGPRPDWTFEGNWGLVGPDRQPLSQAAFNPRTVQPGYGAYTLRVQHVAYFAGGMSAGETRTGCLSYGQWRIYHIDTSGEFDSTFELAITDGISATYVRRSQPPTREPAGGEYDVRSSAGMRLVTASACDVTAPARWYFALYLAGATEAAADGLAPSTFQLGVRLRSASLALGSEEAPWSRGGRGYACCGAMRYFRLPYVPESTALKASINITSGRLRAMYLKWGSCPSFAADVDTVRGVCRGFCALSWLTVRGEYSGTLYPVNASTVVVPHGHGNAPDKRRAGHWYVGVQAMPGEAAHFHLLAEPTTPLYVAAAKRCDKLTYACSADSARRSWDQAGPPAPPPSRAALAWARATGAAGSGLLSAAAVRRLIADDIAQRVATTVGLLLGCVCSCCWYRSWRTRRRLRYRLPHDSM